MEDFVCDRDKWVEGVWIFLIGITLFLSSSFGVIYGHNIYSFASDKRLHAT
jgi:hypothetical protein